MQSQGEDGAAAGLAAMDGRLSARVDPGGGPGTGDTTTATVTVRVPLLLPFVGSGWEVERSVTMPNDRRE
ncbi:hypothetical protein ACIQNU_12450 [Streptomyces sp. NPDC091292]|uniref:hypothetical protein n=1 Tax=Streptomyces sp. NPDC091292 TaxID=3365991 RepID=UPI0038236474